MYKIINVKLEHNFDFIKNDTKQFFYSDVLNVGDIDEIHDNNQIKEMDEVVCLSKN